MKRIFKITLAIALLLLLIGTGTASNTDGFKTLDDYNAFDEHGYSYYTTNTDRYCLVEKVISFDDAFKEHWFKSNEYFIIESIGDNIYKIADDVIELYGYQEIVEVDGVKYMVSIDQNSKLSPSEETQLLDDLKEFNKLNNLKPVQI